MKVVKCENGHFYDLQKDSVCPRCGTDIYTSVSGAMTQNSKVDKKALKEQKKREKIRAKLEKKQRLLMGQPDDVTAGKENLVTTEHVATFPTKPQEVSVRTNANEAMPVESHPYMDDEKTVYIDDEKTVYLDDACEEPAGDFEPVVGWLVCIEGNNRGKSYQLKAGDNNIGRAVDMDVSIQGDNTVTRDRHAILTYEPLNREYLISAGPGRNITYLNGNMVISSNKLKNRDCIRLGKTKLVFVPLCTDLFDWN